MVNSRMAIPMCFFDLEYKILLNIMKDSQTYYFLKIKQSNHVFLEPEQQQLWYGLIGFQKY